MNEKIIQRMDRNRRFGDIVIRRGMGALKLGGRNCSQSEQLFLRIMESVHDVLLENKKRHP